MSRREKGAGSGEKTEPGASGTPAQTPFRSGFVALIGRPNTGKSTLMNTLLDAKVSITTPKPQTTRNRIRGVLTLEGRAQVIFVDTPGIHLWQKKKLNQMMVDAALRAVGDADATILMIDVEHAISEDGAVHELEAYILDQIKNIDTPTILAVNKLDTLSDRDAALPVIAAYQAAYAFDAVVGISALAGANIGALLDLVIERLPEGPMLYPADMYTDQAERFIAGEIIREQIILLTRKEIPYSVAVEIESFKEDSDANLLKLRAVIHVERSSQKGIVIGKQGAMLRTIGERSRKQLERFFGRRVFLETFVRVEKAWSDDAKTLGRFGYDPNVES